MAVIEAHGSGGGDVGEHGLVIVGERSIFVRVALSGAALLQRAAVGVGAVGSEPVLYLVDGHADEELLEGVHLLGPGAGAHDVAVAAVALRDPALDLARELLLGVGRRAVDNGVVVGVVVIAALAGPAAEVRHGGAVVVRGRVLKLVDVDGNDPALAVEERVGKDLVDTVDRRARVVGAGAHTDRVGKAEAEIGLRGLDGLDGVAAVAGIGARTLEGVLDGVDDAVARVGRAGNHIDVRRIGGNYRFGYLLERAGGDTERLAVVHNGYAGYGVAVHGHLDGNGAYEAVGRAGEGTVRAAARLAEGILDGIDDAVAGIGGTGHDVYVGRVGLDNGRGDLLEGVGRDAGRLAVGDDGHGGDVVAVHGHLDGDGAAKAAALTGEGAVGARAGVGNIAAGAVDGGHDGTGGDGGAGDGVHISDAEAALAVEQRAEEVPVVLGLLAETVGLVGLEDGHAVDGTVVKQADEQMDVVREAGDGHLYGDALGAAVNPDDAFVGAGVLLHLVLAAARDDVLQDGVELLLPVALGCAGKSGAGRKEHHSAGQDDGHGDKQFFQVHFPAPPFATPKRLMGIALSSAQAQAFMMRMA